MQPPTVPSQPRRTDGLAVASLVLAFTGVLCFFTPPAGIICGIVALRRIGRSQGALTGRGLAIAGIVISVLFLLLAPALVLPAMKKARERAEQIKCMNNLKSIGAAARLMASTNSARLPETFAAMQAHLGTPRILACPKSGVTIMAARFAGFDFNTVTYRIISPAATAGDTNTIFIQCPSCGNALRADGAVARGPSHAGPTPQP
jgi:hypothetical protein